VSILHVIGENVPFLQLNEPRAIHQSEAFQIILGASNGRGIRVGGNRTIHALGTQHQGRNDARARAHVHQGDGIIIMVVVVVVVGWYFLLKNQIKVLVSIVGTKDAVVRMDSKGSDGGQLAQSTGSSVPLLLRIIIIIIAAATTNIITITLMIIDDIFQLGLNLDSIRTPLLRTLHTLQFAQRHQKQAAIVAGLLSQGAAVFVKTVPEGLGNVGGRLVIMAQIELQFIVLVQALVDVDLDEQSIQPSGVPSGPGAVALPELGE